jgi:hypothetical protein
MWAQGLGIAADAGTKAVEGGLCTSEEACCVGAGWGLELAEGADGRQAGQRAAVGGELL